MSKTNFEKLTQGMFKKAYQGFSSGVLEAAPWAQTKAVPEHFAESLRSEWFQGYAKQNQSKQLRALDVGCGVGDISRDLQRFGFRVTGIDYEQTAIDEANKKSAGLEGHLSPRYLVGNALDLDAVLINSEDKEFDLAYEFSLLHHLDPETRNQYFESVAKHLSPQGKFCVTCFTDTDTTAEVDATIAYMDGEVAKTAKFSNHGGKGVPTFLLSETEIRDAAQDCFIVDDVSYIDVVRFDKDGNKLPIAKRIKVLMTRNK
jgi:2-polyprenyl-3-methyl-5-hydroxy-6-metoxy-1,4-benzoquinol methylase